MFKLKARQERREYIAKVNSGEIKDPVISHGTTASGVPADGNGKPINGDDTTTDDTGAGVDFTKLKSHDDLNGPDGLGDREKPEGWDDMKVVDKQKWLTDNANPASSGW